MCSYDSLIDMKWKIYMPVSANNLRYDENAKIMKDARNASVAIDLATEKGKFTVSFNKCMVQKLFESIESVQAKLDELTK